MIFFKVSKSKKKKKLFVCVCVAGGGGGGRGVLEGGIFYKDSKCKKKFFEGMGGEGGGVFTG